ncbi:MAG: hypothetical protein JXB34_07925 [Bacteroidales bacterium]|nr:hypothetical protein [Bacteroidales bacterium]
MKQFLFTTIVAVSLLCFSSCETNKKPEGNIQLERTSVLPEQTIFAISNVTDDDPDMLEINWQVSAGKLTERAKKDTVWWETPAAPGQHTISLTAKDEYHSVTFNENMEVLPCDYYDQYQIVKVNQGVYNLDADIFDGKLRFLGVFDEDEKPYGHFTTSVSHLDVTFNNALVSFAYEPYSNGSISFVFYFEADDLYEGYQLEAVQLDLKPLSTTENWELLCKVKDFSTGYYYWESLDESSYGHKANISTVYNEKFQEVRLERTANNDLNFYFENELVYTSKGIANKLADGQKFDPTLNRILFYIYNDTYMEMDYLYLYE